MEKYIEDEELREEGEEKGRGNGEGEKGNL